MNSAAKTAYLLVTHGSRDPRSQAGVEALAEQLRQRLGGQQLGGNRWVEAEAQNLPGQKGADSRGAGQIAAIPQQSGFAIATAVLELGPAPLHQQIEKLAHQFAAMGVTHLKLLPLFLLPGVHVREDLPEEVALARAALAKQASVAHLALELLPHIGADDALVSVLRAQQQSLLEQFSEQLSRQVDPSPEPILVGAGGGTTVARSAMPRPELDVSDVDWVVVAHGSRRPGAVTAIAELAQLIQASSAYWVGSPSLADCVEAQRGKAHRPLGLLSYFLFAGGITDRLALQLEAAEADSPALLSAPLGAFDALVDVVADAIQRAC